MFACCKNKYGVIELVQGLKPRVKETKGFKFKGLSYYAKRTAGLKSSQS